MKRTLALLLLIVSAFAGAQGIWINDAGVLREIKGVWVNDAGVLREIQTAWVNDSGTLRQIYQVITLGGGDGGTIEQADAVSTYDTTVAIRFNTDGTIETGLSEDGAAITWSSAGDWIDPNAGASADYDVRFTNFNGAGGGDWTAEAAADDAWIALVTASRLWSMNSTVQESISFTADFEVRDGSGAPPVTGSASYTFSITNTL
jgi:hypothetical protein